MDGATNGVAHAILRDDGSAGAKSRRRLSPPVTSRPGGVRAASLPLVLLSVYVAALILFPADFGLRLLGFVWSPARIVLLLLVFVSVVTGALSMQVIRSEQRAVLIGWLAFLLVAVIATVLHPTPGAIPRLLSLGIEGMVLYFVARAVASEPVATRMVLKVAVLTTLVVVVIALLAGLVGLRYDSILTVLGGGPMPPASGERFGFIRQQGPFPAALFFAIWLAACTALVLPWFLARERSIVASSAATWVVLVFGIAVLTVSRVALPCAFLLAGIYLWRWGHRVVAGAALVVAFAIAFGFAGLSVGTTAPTASGPSPGSSSPPGASATATPAPTSESDALASSNEARIKAIQATIQAVAQEPLFGWGLLRAKDVVTTIGGSTNYVDSSYLVNAVEMGIVGLVAFLVLVGSVLVAGRRAWSTHDGMALGLSCVAILAMTALAAYLNVTQGYATFWLLAALMVNSAVAAGRTSSAG
jgi:hypothetical protein